MWLENPQREKAYDNEGCWAELKQIRLKYAGDCALLTTACLQVGGLPSATNEV